ncbi:hypothetical protein LXL04_023410 [Taraxacum kok-saghyz]
MILQSIFHVLAALYGVVTVVALVQLIRIQLRVPEYGWTTQKVFHFLNVLVNGEIYYQARAVSTDGLRPTFFTINGIIYTIQMVLWLVIWWIPITLFVVLSTMFLAGVTLFAALGRLFSMLQHFLVKSKGRRKKLHEVGYVTTICFVCSLIFEVFGPVLEVIM